MIQGMNDRETLGSLRIPLYRFPLIRALSAPDSALLQALKAQERKSNLGDTERKPQSNFEDDDVASNKDLTLTVLHPPPSYEP